MEFDYFNLSMFRKTVFLFTNCMDLSKRQQIKRGYFFLKTTGPTLPVLPPLPHYGYGYFYRIATKERIRDRVHRAEIFFSLESWSATVSKRNVLTDEKKKTILMPLPPYTFLRTIHFHNVLKCMIFFTQKKKALCTKNNVACRSWVSSHRGLFFPWYEIDAFVLCARSSKLWRDKVNPAKNEATQVHAWIVHFFRLHIFQVSFAPQKPTATGSLRTLRPKDSVVINEWIHTMFTLALSNPNNSSAKS